MRQETYADVPDPRRPVERADGTVASSGAAVFVRRVSWGAILAGAIVVLVCQLLLSVLGVGIGVSTVDPLGESPEASTLSIGAGVWWLVTALISVFAGSWVAGRLSGAPVRTDGLLHGLVTWGVATLVMFYVLTTALSSLVGGAFGLMGSALGVAGSGAQQAAQASNGQGQAAGPLGEIQRQIQGMLGQTLQGAQEGAQQVQQAAQDPQVQQVVQKAVRSGPDSLSPAEREMAINALVQHANMTRPEAEQRMAEWQRQYQTAKHEAAEAAEATADAVSKASIWSFVGLVLGAIVAGVGGAAGSPRDLRVAV